MEALLKPSPLIPLEDVYKRQLSSIAKIALEILHGLEAQPCENNNGVVNGQDLKKYAKELLEAAKSEMCIRDRSRRAN